MSRKAIDQVPDNDTYLDTYAWVLFRLGDYKEAREYQAKAIELAEERKDTGADLYDLEPDREVLKKKVKNKTFFYE